MTWPICTWKINLGLSLVMTDFYGNIMPMTRTQRADYHAQFGGWSPHERAYFISRLFGAAHTHDIHDLATLRRVLVAGLVFPSVCGL
ncbi:hypothetical protein ACJIZ3_021534 [Penstemon smallii]|uniref:Uncharacterized protein n=1 Tax=Penstemon smallii TaxID=265156 RepID=A0ABD3SMC0_9LAMI